MPAQDPTIRHVLKTDGNCYSNGLLLIKIFTEHGLFLTNTMFQLPVRNIATWMNTRSKHWHLIDFIIIRRKDMNDVRVTKSMCGADCWTNHRRIKSNMNLYIQSPRRPQGKNNPKRLNVSKLKYLMRSWSHYHLTPTTQNRTEFFSKMLYTQSVTAFQVLQRTNTRTGSMITMKRLTNSWKKRNA